MHHSPISLNFFTHFLWYFPFLLHNYCCTDLENCTLRICLCPFLFLTAQKAGSSGFPVTFSYVGKIITQIFCACESVLCALGKVSLHAPTCDAENGQRRNKSECTELWTTSHGLNDGFTPPVPFVSLSPISCWTLWYTVISARNLFVKEASFPTTKPYLKLMNVLLLRLSKGLS